MTQSFSRWLVLTLLFIGLTTATASYAATIMERRDRQNQLETFLLEGDLVRLENRDSDNYRLMNLAENKAYAINVKEKKMVVMPLVATPPEMPANMPKPPASAPIKAELLKQGDGPTITGYTTVIYQVTADGRPCSDTYFSQEATKIPFLQDFLKAYNQLSYSRKPKGLPQPPCQQAHENLVEQLLALGIPMKMVMKGREKDTVLFEIVNLKTDEKVNADMFTVPKDYQEISEAEMIKQRRKQMQQWMDQEAREGNNPNRRPSSE